MEVRLHVPLMRFSAVLYKYFWRRRLRLSCGMSRKVYVLIAVNAISSWSSRYMCGFLRHYNRGKRRL